MHNTVCVGQDLFWLGGNDRRIALFESVYPVSSGVSYNSYLLLDEQTVLFDTVDVAVEEVFFEGLLHLLGDRPLDYLVVHHVEPDHSATLARVVEKYPSVKLVLNQKSAQMVKQYFGNLPVEQILVKEGDTLCTGTHTLKFVFAPMVHWPEVMLTFDETTGTLFSADAFGTFGALGGSIFADGCHFERDYLAEARRYYTNIVGKYGVQVQAVLKKAANLPIQTVCPLHGPIWRENFGWFLEKYLLWSSYTPEDKGVAIFYASVYGHTQNAAEILATALSEAGVSEVKTYDVSVTDCSELVSECFRLSHLVFASTTYNNGIFVNMERFLTDLKQHSLKNRSYSLVENGTWAPQAGKLMEELLSSMAGMNKVGETVKLLSAVGEQTQNALRALAQEIASSISAE